MPRTKHLVVALLLVIIPLMGYAVSLVFVGQGSALSLMPTHQALLINATDIPMEVAVYKDTTREDNRSDLMEKLRDYEESAPVTIPLSDVPLVQEEKTEVEATPSIEEVKTIFLCEDERVSGSGVSSWGLVTATTAEGARIIASSARGDSGAPLHALQLPLTPVVNEKETCLPSGMIGIARDGRIIESNVPFLAYGSILTGYALDGFAIYGPVEDGKAVTNDILDSCHGHVHTVVDQDVPSTVYHYHVTNDMPYTLGCFKGTPIQF